MPVVEDVVFLPAFDVKPVDCVVPFAAQCHFDRRVAPCEQVQKDADAAGRLDGFLRRAALDFFIAAEDTEDASVMSSAGAVS